MGLKPSALSREARLRGLRQAAQAAFTESSPRLQSPGDQVPEDFAPALTYNTACSSLSPVCTTTSTMLHLSLLHTRLPITISLALTALVLWGVICALRGTVDRGYTAALWVAELLIIAQALLGLPLLFAAAQPARLAMHIVYGGVALALLPAASAYARGRVGRGQAVFYAVMCLFLLGVAMRAALTGGA